MTSDYAVKVVVKSSLYNLQLTTPFATYFLYIYYLSILEIYFRIARVEFIKHFEWQLILISRFITQIY